MNRLGDHIVTYGGDPKRMFVWSRKSGKRINEIKVGKFTEVTIGETSGPTTKIAISKWREKVIQVFEIPSGRELLNVKADMGSISFSASLDRLVGRVGASELGVLDLKTKQLARKKFEAMQFQMMGVFAATDSENIAVTRLTRENGKPKVVLEVLDPSFKSLGQTTLPAQVNAVVFNKVAMAVFYGTGLVEIRNPSSLQLKHAHKYFDQQTGFTEFSVALVNRQMSVAVILPTIKGNSQPKPVVLSLTSLKRSLPIDVSLREVALLDGRTIVFSPSRSGQRLRLFTTAGRELKPK